MEGRGGGSKKKKKRGQTDDTKAAKKSREKGELTLPLPPSLIFHHGRGEIITRTANLCHVMERDPCQSPPKWTFPH